MIFRFRSFAYLLVTVTVAGKGVSSVMALAMLVTLISTSGEGLGCRTTRSGRGDETPSFDGQPQGAGSRHLVFDKNLPGARFAEGRVPRQQEFAQDHFVGLQLDPGQLDLHLCELNPPRENLGEPPCAALHSTNSKERRALPSLVELSVSSSSSFVPALSASLTRLRSRLAYIVASAAPRRGRSWNR